MAPRDPREIELKLELDPGDVVALKTRMPKLGRGGETQHLVSVYYDTRKQVLRANGLSLRVRTVDGRRVQTVKAAQGGSSGIFDRSEWETEIDGDGVDIAALAETPVAAVLPKGRHGLKPVFETVVDRTVWMAKTKRSSIEIALDEGRIVAGETAQPLVELELELKRGRPADLFRLLRRLDGTASLRTGMRTKSERGYALADGKKAPRAFKAEPVRLQSDMTTADAFRSILHNCLRQFRLNEPLVVEGRAVEALHQARVGMRRLRSALSLFDDIAADARVGTLKSSLRDVSRQLGDARNLDVYLAQSARPEFERDRAEPGVAAFLAEMERRRTEAYDGIVATLGSKPFRSLMVDLLEWGEAGLWLDDRDPMRASLRDGPVSLFAAEVLEKQWRKVAKKGRHLDKLDAPERHRVRIAAKKLRYASEFFAGLAANDKARERHATFIAALEDLQQHLGDLNDIQTGHEIALGFADGTPTAPRAGLFAAAHISGAQDARVDNLLGAACHAHRGVAKAKRFWSKWDA